MPMTPEAKKALSTTIRALRERTLVDLHNATETAYRLSVSTKEAALPEIAAARRLRLEAWIEEQLRADVESRLAAKRKGTWTPDVLAAEREKLCEGLQKDGTAARLRREIEKRAAYTLLHRLVLIRMMEAMGLRSRPVVTGGLGSRGYKDFRDVAPALVRGDESEGYTFLLQLVFDELAVEMPGLFGRNTMGDLVPVPVSTLRHVLEALDAEVLQPCWTDPLTLGWVYQYWNDPEREALDDKLNDGGKVEPHEIASKTQMFTERYIVDWLLQNTLGPLWLAMCDKHGWTPEVLADGTLSRLEARRIEWRGKRERGEVSLTELMPLQTEAERRWAYFVPQPQPEDAKVHAPDSLRELKILDPAVGSGHFLVVAFELLLALYREEARHRQQKPGFDPAQWSDQAITLSILRNNLHGIDIDPRAVQIAAASLWLSARRVAPGVRPERVNLVASDLRLAGLRGDDPALVELRREVARETGVPHDLTDTIVHALRGADHLGSLLRVDATVEEAVSRYEQTLGGDSQRDLFQPSTRPQTLDRDAAKSSLLARLDTFLAQHTRGEDIGLRLRGEQLASGVRFVQLVREGQYHIVVGNPPYQGTAKMADATYVQKTYPRGKADLYAAFLERGMQLARPGGVSALLTMRNWMFIQQYEELRTWLLQSWDLRALGDLASGAFEEISAAQVVVSVVMSVFRKRPPTNGEGVALRFFDDKTLTQIGETERKRAAMLAGVGRTVFRPGALRVVSGWPVVYWWSQRLLDEYAAAPKLGDATPIRYGLSTQNNTRWLRKSWEVGRCDTMLCSFEDNVCWDQSSWVPYIKGAVGRQWLDEVSDVLLWRLAGCELWAYPENRWGRGTSHYFKRGVAFVNIGDSFSARAHRMASIFGHVAGSVFEADTAEMVCLLNSARAKMIMESLNPGLHFLTTDVARLPLLRIQSSKEIFSVVESAFTKHESHREPSVEYKRPGPSPWRHAQAWAQTAVDRPEGAPLPPYEPLLDPEPPTDHLSFALGVALGRFSPNHEGILDPSTADLSHALPSGLLFLDGTLDPTDPRGDSLGHPAAALLHTTWATHGPHIDTKHKDVRSYLRLSFFGEVHRGMYDNRPIHWPVSSGEKTFVAYINIHRWTASTLNTLLADHLVPTRTRLDGELADIKAVRDGADTKAAKAAERRLAKLQKWREELAAFIADVTACAEKGPKADPSDKGAVLRERDARYAPVLDDGVMINSSALWPVLEPQWKDPRKWWRELTRAQGRKDYDWSHLARRYFPSRVDEKCRADPSLGVAHGCFWLYHPARAWAWELRLQDEIGPDFRIEEAAYTHPDGTASKEHTALRAAYLAEHPDEALAAVESEAMRRIGRGKSRKIVPEMRILEVGLWSVLPAACFEMEIRVSEKQGSAFCLRAPDEPKARAAYEAAHPEAVAARKAKMAALTPAAELFEEEPEVDTQGEESPDEG